MPTAVKSKPKARAKTKVTSNSSDMLSSLCLELQRSQRKRAIVIKSRIMQANRLQAIVAGTLGYSAGMNEKHRLKKFAEASALIEAVKYGEQEHDLQSIINATLEGIRAFDIEQVVIERDMMEIAKQLPVVDWVKDEQQRGFGLPLLAVVIGETGDLNQYAGPAKVWRRMGCAPFESHGKVHMGSTWRFGKEGKLSADEWTAFGYSPRRRSIAYLIGDCLIKANKSIYRARYDEAKATIAAAHPDYQPMRCHRHGMLLATKLLLKNLWVAWRA